MNTTKTTRELDAEYAVLNAFDFERYGLGHDYGNGQRKAELMRRAAELRSRGVHHVVEPELEEFTAAELKGAWQSVAVPRLRRIENEDYRRSTPSTRRTIAAWNKTSRAIDAAAAELTSPSVDAHADGAHVDAPREGCRECERSLNGYSR